MCGGRPGSGAGHGQKLWQTRSSSEITIGFQLSGDLFRGTLGYAVGGFNGSADVASPSAVENDPDRGVKEQAVNALKQLPPDQGIPLLIEVAKNNPDSEVRKRAMRLLGQSNDPRALDYFAQVLK